MTQALNLNGICPTGFDLAWKKQSPPSINIHSGMGMFALCLSPYCIVDSVNLFPSSIGSQIGILIMFQDGSYPGSNPYLI